jgi:hypothetical protein
MKVNVSVEVKYSVTVEVDVDDITGNQLINASGEDIGANDAEHCEAIEWIADNINEKDAYDWNYDLEVEKIKGEK